MKSNRSSRRRFCKVLSTATAIGTVSSASFAFGHSSPSFDHKDYCGLIGERFQIWSSTQSPVDAVLTTVDLHDYGHDADRPKSLLRHRAFSVILRVDSNVSFHDGIMVLAHPKLGEQSLFMVPIGSNGELEIVYN